MIQYLFTKQIPKRTTEIEKRSKFDNKTFFKLYPSDAIPPRLNRVMKAHKPEEKLSYEDNSVNDRNCMIWNIKIFS